MLSEKVDALTSVTTDDRKGADSRNL
jgi:hypothetical protein